MRRWTGAIAIAAAAAGITASQLGAQSGQGPTARYQMDVSTTSGMMAGMGGGGMMGALMGRRGGGGPQHSLLLRLGSSLAPTGGGPHADHFMPDGAQLGPSVPLETPTHVATTDTPDDTTPEQFRKPKGRMLIFWGCGAHAGPGQPLVLDFSRLAAGQVPPAIFSVSVPPDRGPTESNSRTYGAWPNGKGRRQLGPGSSLLGQHRIAGNYSPEISFALDQDFMPALVAQHTSASDGSTPMSWNTVQGATGYYAMLFGAKQMGQDNADMVIWSSAARREIGGGLSEWLAPATVARLIGEHVVMPPSQTSCTVPAEVKAAAGEFMMAQLFAYGPERDFAYPPRPANPRAPWRPEWTVRARFRSNTSMILGMPGMGEMGDDRGGQQPGDRPDQSRRRCKPSILGVIRGNAGC